MASEISTSSELISEEVVQAHEQCCSFCMSRNTYFVKLDLDQVTFLFNREPDQSMGTVKAEFGADMGAVILNRSRTDVQNCGNFPVGF